MKIDRRSFLAFVLGGAAGTALSPLPWKVTDDIAIWTQNWPWTPVIAKGETFYETSACTLCPGGCGITVRKVDNRVVKIEAEHLALALHHADDPERLAADPDPRAQRRAAAGPGPGRPAERLLCGYQSECLPHHAAAVGFRKTIL